MGDPVPALRQLRQPGSPAPCASPDPRTATGDWRPAVEEPCRSSTVQAPAAARRGCRWQLLPPLPRGVLQTAAGFPYPQGFYETLPEGPPKYLPTCPTEASQNRLPAQLGGIKATSCLRSHKDGNFDPQRSNSEVKMTSFAGERKKQLVKAEVEAGVPLATPGHGP